MMNRLTIAIPTYNRKDLLRECLNSIIPQIVEGVDIYISDNASSDGTKQMIEKEFNMPFIRYQRNEGNIGPDKNFIQCFNNGDGEYLHMLSDDDIMLPGTINAILKYSEKKPSMIYLNNCLLGDENQISRNDSYRIYFDVTDFINDIGIYITFLSSMVLRQEYLDCITDKEQFIGTNFPQSYMAIECLGQGKCAIVKETPGIAFRAGDAHGYSFYHVWITEYIKMLKHLTKIGCSADDIKKFYTNSLNRDIAGFIIGFRIYGTKLDMSGKRELLEQTKNMPRAWLRLYLAAFTPTFILRMASKVKHVIWNKLKKDLR